MLKKGSALVQSEALEARRPPKLWHTGSTGFSYARIMKADAEAQSGLIGGVISALEAAVERYDKQKVQHVFYTTK